MFKLVMFIVFITLNANNIKYHKIENNNSIQLIYRLNNPTSIDNYDIKIKDNKVKSTQKDASASIYFFIDTSVPMKEAFTKGIKPLLSKLIIKLPTQIKYAISGFDRNINKVKDFDATYTNQLDNILINGQRTEINRLGLIALQELAKQTTDNKIFVLISDGDFEDTAYTTDEIVKKANDNNITILSIGYRDSVKIQGIQKPAQQTHGKLWVADKSTHQIKESFFDEFNRYISNTHTVTIDKKDISPTISATENIVLEVVSNNEKISQIIAIKVAKKESFTLYYVVSIVLGLLIISYIIFKRKQKANTANNVKSETLDPIAYLQDSSGKNYNIIGATTSMGRNSDNDIVIDGSFMSSFHADILYKHNEFFINDKNSTNGILVNKSKITQIKINDQDIINLGPLELKFIII